MLINIQIWFLACATALYLIIIAVATIGWFKLKRVDISRTNRDVKLSIVVACRNEALKIEKLLGCLLAQDYKNELTEIIIVDDHSEDETVSVISDFIKLQHIKNMKVTASKGQGKKEALSQGIEVASGELIVTTDADCEMGSRWLSGLAAFYSETGAQLIAGPVVHINEKGLSQNFFSLDFLSLVAFGAGSMGIGLPFMGNAANLAFSREGFNKIQSEVTSENFVSGDDVFLIQKMTKEYGSKAVRFLKNPVVVVKTDPPENWKQFIRQRVRWGSKSKAYLTLWSVLVPLVVFLSNLLLVAVFVLALVKPWFFVIYFLYVILKTLVDFPLLLDFSNFFGKRKLLRFFFPFEFIYPFYITYTALLSLFSKFEWKGRKGLR